MSQSQVPLYPKLSPIYNKIMQLAIAIVLIIALLNILVFSHEYNENKINTHFDDVSRVLSQQTASVLMLLHGEEPEAIKQFVSDFLPSHAVSSLLYYDASGQLLAASPGSKKMNELYGISKNKLNISHEYIPFVEELYDQDKLSGYIRLTINKKMISEKLLKANDKTNELYRIMLVLAGLVGFLLTRGLNRFSRQGFRLAK